MLLVLKTAPNPAHPCRQFCTGTVHVHCKASQVKLFVFLHAESESLLWFGAVVRHIIPALLNARRERIVVGYSTSPNSWLHTQAIQVDDV